MKEDLRNIVLHVESEKAAKYIQDRFGFSDLVDVVRLGFAYALARETSLTPGDWGSRATNYNTSTVDGEDGLLSALVRRRPELEAEETPFRTIEVLMNKGLLEIKAGIDGGLISSLTGLIESTRDSD